MPETDERTLSIVDEADFYDSVIAGLFYLLPKFEVNKADLERYGGWCQALALWLLERDDVELEFYVPRQTPACGDGHAANLRYRIAHYAVMRFIYHWTDNLVEPRGSYTAKSLVELFYELPIPLDEWLAEVKRVSELHPH